LFFWGGWLFLAGGVGGGRGVGGLGWAPGWCGGGGGEVRGRGPSDLQCTRFKVFAPIRCATSLSGIGGASVEIDLLSRSRFSFTTDAPLALRSRASNSLAVLDVPASTHSLYGYYFWSWTSAPRTINVSQVHGRSQFMIWRQLFTALLHLQLPGRLDSPANCPTPLCLI